MIGKRTSLLNSTRYYNFFGKTYKTRNTFCSQDRKYYEQMPQKLRLPLTICPTSYCDAACKFCIAKNTCKREKIDLKKLIDEEFEGGDVSVVANLPYYITTPIIMKLLEENPGFKSITVMVQKEVADRLAANPGGKNCGAITYSINYFCEAEKVVDVPPEAFMPAPKVWSSVIKLTLRDKPPVDCKSQKHMFELIKSAFLMRRKTFINCVSQSKVIDCDKETLREILANMEISETVRGEALTLVQYSQISDEILSRNL